MRSPRSKQFSRARRSESAATRPLLLLLTVALVVGILPSQLLASALAQSPDSPAPAAAPHAVEPDPTPSPSASPSPSAVQPSSTPEPSTQPAKISAPLVPVKQPLGARPADGEVLDRRTESSRTILNSDGSYTVESFSGPIHFKDKKGALQPIESDLVASDKPGYAVKNKANSFGVNIKDQLGPEANALDVAGKSYTLSPQGVGDGEASLTDKGINYTGASAGADVAYEITQVGLKETITLAGPDAATSFTTLLKGPSGTQVTEENDGSLTVRDFKGAPVFSFDPPWAEEQAELDKPQRSDAILDPKNSHASLSAKVVPAGVEITLAVNASWIQAEGPQFSRNC